MTNKMVNAANNSATNLITPLLLSNVPRCILIAILPMNFHWKVLRVRPMYRGLDLPNYFVIKHIKPYGKDVTARRIHEARMLLDETNICVRDVARLCGFSHHSHFFARFAAGKWDDSRCMAKADTTRLRWRESIRNGMIWNNII